MKDSRSIVVAIILLVIALPILAQKGTKTPPSNTGLTVAEPKAKNEKPRQFDDSVEFDKIFKEFYPLVKPKQTVREMAEKQVERQVMGMTKQGIDSMDIVKVAYVGLDENAGYKIYRDAYRQKLSAKELKAYLAFVKTPEGAKVQSVFGELLRSQSDLNNYVTKTVTTNLTPIRATMREKSLKMQKEKEEQMKSDTTEVGRSYRQQMHMRDSILKARGIDKLTDPSQSTIGR